MKKCETCWKFSCPYRNSCNGEMCIYDTDDSFDWQSFRAEAAKDILAGMMSHPKVLYGSNIYKLAKYAIEYADEIIKQLKEKEEK